MNDTTKNRACLRTLGAPGVNRRREVDRGIRWILELHAHSNRLARREAACHGYRQVRRSGKAACRVHQSHIGWHPREENLHGAADHAAADIRQGHRAVEGSAYSAVGQTGGCRLDFAWRHGGRQLNAVYACDRYTASTARSCKAAVGRVPGPRVKWRRRIPLVIDADKRGLKSDEVSGRWVRGSGVTGKLVNSRTVQKRQRRARIRHAVRARGYYVWERWTPPNTFSRGWEGAGKGGIAWGNVAERVVEGKGIKHRHAGDRNIPTIGRVAKRTIAAYIPR